MQISTWGPHAERFVARHASARLVAAFPRSLHLQAAVDFLCIGDASIGCGSLNASLDAGDWARLARVIPPVETPIRIEHGTLRIGSIAVATSGAKPWRPAAWPPAAAGERLMQSLARLDHLARDRAPTDGLARAALGLAREPGSALDRVAQPRVARLRAWLIARLASAGVPPPVDLLGLGPGLTPSGDDLLGGALVALHAVGEAEAAHALYAQITEAAPAATSPLSGAFLRAAAEGLGAEPLHAAIIALLGGLPDLSAPIAALARTGHTSGWDALAGAVLVLQAFSTTAVQRTGVARPEISL